MARLRICEALASLCFLYFCVHVGFTTSFSPAFAFLADKCM